MKYSLQFGLEASKEFAEQLKRQAHQGKLRNLKISGNRASGATTEHFEITELEPGKKKNVVKDPYDREIRFAKEKNGWRIDEESALSQESPGSSP